MPPKRKPSPGTARLPWRRSPGSPATLKSPSRNASEPEADSFSDSERTEKTPSQPSGASAPPGALEAVTDSQPPGRFTLSVPTQSAGGLLSAQIPRDVWDSLEQARAVLGVSRSTVAVETFREAIRLGILPRPRQLAGGEPHVLELPLNP